MVHKGALHFLPTFAFQHSYFWLRLAAALDDREERDRRIINDWEVGRGWAAELTSELLVLQDLLIKPYAYVTDGSYVTWSQKHFRATVLVKMHEFIKFFLWMLSNEKSNNLVNNMLHVFNYSTQFLSSKNETNID